MCLRGRKHQKAVVHKLTARLKKDASHLRLQVTPRDVRECSGRWAGAMCAAQLRHIRVCGGEGVGRTEQEVRKL